MTEVIEHGHSFISHPSTMVPTYPRGIGSAFHRAGGAGREHKGHGVLIWIAETPAPLPARRAYRPEGRAYAPEGGQSRSNPA